MCLQEPSGRKEIKQCVSVQENSQYVWLVVLSFGQNVSEELPWREPQLDGSEEKRKADAQKEHTKGCVSAFQAPY